MKKVDKFLKKISNNRNKLSNLEREVLDFIIEKPEKIESLTSEELSNKIFVSTATISRTCKKLGFSGFQELKYLLIQYRSEFRQQNEAPKNYSSLDYYVNSFSTEIENNLSEIASQISGELVELITKSNHIEFFGVGSSLPVCLEGARKMTFAGRLATARSDWDELRTVAGCLTENDLAIIISLSGETLHIIEYANILSENNVPILSIIGTESSLLEKMSTYTLKRELSTLYFDDVDMSSRYILNMIVDLLVIKYINQ